MKKLILILVIVAAAAVAGAPYFIGTTVEQGFRAEHEAAAREARLSGLEVELLDYKRGYLDAVATTRIGIIVPEDEEKVYVDLRHHISHIPQPGEQVIATIDSELLLDGKALRLVNPLFKGQSPFTANTRVFLDGHQEGTFNSPAASGELSEDGEAVVIEWQGLEGSVWESAARDHITFKMKSPGLVATPVLAEPSNAANDAAVTAPAAAAEQATDVAADPATTAGETEVATDEEMAEEMTQEEFDALLAEAAGQEGRLESLTLTQFSYEGDMNKAESGMWQGKASGHLASFAVKGTDKSGMPVDMQFNGVAMQGEQAERNGLIQASGSFNAKQVNFNGFELTNAVYDLAVENLDAGAMRAWQEAAGKMMEGVVDAQSPFASMLPHLPALVNAKPVIKVNELSVDSPMGHFAMKLDARLNGEWNDALLENPMMFASMLKADVDASVPRAVVVSMLQQKMREAIIMQAAASEMELSDEELEAAVSRSTEQQITGLITQGLIKENEAQLESRLEYNAGQLTINGQDASGLMGALMQ